MRTRTWENTFYFSLNFNLLKYNINPKGIFCEIPDFKYYYIDHYYSKSTEEFINKINRGGGVLYNSTRNKYLRLNLYFRFNKITMEKINYISQKANLNASIIIKNINYNITR